MDVTVAGPLVGLGAGPVAVFIVMSEVIQALWPDAPLGLCWGPSVVTLVT